MEKLATVVFIFAGILHVAGAQTPMVVRIYNPAQLKLGTLATAQDEAAYILGSAGIQTNWITCIRPSDCPTPPSTSEVVVRLAPDSVFPKRNTQHRLALGRSVTGRGPLPDYVEVFCAPVQTLVRETATPATIGEVIGAVIAHEIGHLLLGPQHTRMGLMSACWNSEDLAFLAKRRLKFDQLEKAELRWQLALRMAPRPKEETGVFARNQLGR